MLSRRLVIARWAVGLLVLAASVACGQEYPSKPIRIVTATVGGGNDLSARIVASGISGPLGQSVVVENRASGFIAAEIVAKSPPDGYTLTVNGSNLWILPLLQKTPYDVVRDFAPISLLARDISVVTVHPSLPVKSIKDLIALAKARPAELNYASSSVGGSSNLGAELIKSMAGVNIVQVPYKGTAASLNAVMRGEVQMTIQDAGNAAPHAKSGKLRALAVTSAQPSALFPGLPTVASSGLPGFEAVSMTTIFATAKTPPAIIQRLNQEIVRVINRPDVKEKYFNMAIETVGSSPEYLVATIESEIARWSKVIKDAGIKVE